MNAWEREVTRHLNDAEYRFLTEYDRWLRGAFSQIPIGANEHAIHAFHLVMPHRLSVILTKHSIDTFSMGQGAADKDVADLHSRHQRRLADNNQNGQNGPTPADALGASAARASGQLPRFEFTAGSQFTPTDAIRVLQRRAITLAGEVENDATSAVKEILIHHLAGDLRRPEAEQQIAKLLQANMNRASLIVTTETTYAYNQGRLIQYRGAGVDYVQYQAVMDGRTCEICASRNGLVAPITAIGGNTPPVHGRCRCVLSPVFSTYQPHLLTPERLDWSKVAPLPKGWVA